MSLASLALGLTLEDGSGIHGPIIGRGTFIPANVKNFDLETGLSIDLWYFGLMVLMVLK